MLSVNEKGKFCSHNPSIALSTLQLHLDQKQKFHMEAEWWGCIHFEIKYIAGSYQHAKSWHIVGKESENSGIMFALSLTSLCMKWWVFRRREKAAPPSAAKLRSERDQIIDNLFYVTIPVFRAHSKTNKLLLRLLRMQYCQVLSVLELLITAILDLWWYLH